jgi:hypothetical protein
LSQDRAAPCFSSPNERAARVSGSLSSPAGGSLPLALPPARRLRQIKSDSYDKHRGRSEAREAGTQGPNVARGSPLDLPFPRCLPCRRRRTERRSRECRARSRRGLADHRCRLPSVCTFPSRSVGAGKARRTVSRSSTGRYVLSIGHHLLCSALEGLRGLSVWPRSRWRRWPLHRPLPRFGRSHPSNEQSGLVRRRPPRGPR